MILRRALLACLGLWVGLGIVLAPARPMPGMEMGTAPSLAQPIATTQGIMLEHAGHRDTQPEVSGHHKAVPAPSPGRPASEPETSGHDHLARCVLCVVGAGMLTLIVVVVWASRLTHTHIPRPRLFTQPKRFRHFQSRAPPLSV